MTSRKTYRCAGVELSIHLNRVDAGPPEVFRVAIGDAEMDIRVRAITPDTLYIVQDGRSRIVHLRRSGSQTRVAISGRVYDLASGEERRAQSPVQLGSPELRSPMPGTILEILVSEGQRVAAGDDLVILEAMKMENRIRAELAGSVQAVAVAAGDRVESGDVLVRILAD